MGADGATARHRYVLEQHFLGNRVQRILDTLRRVGATEYTIGVTEQENLYIETRAGAPPGIPGPGGRASLLRRVFGSIFR